MDATRGVYDSKAERLVMQDTITIATSSGVSGKLKHASLDTKTQTLRSHRPVSFLLPNGSVKANALTFQSGEHTLTFRGKVVVHIVKPQKQTKPASKEQAPAPQSVPPMPQADRSSAGGRRCPAGGRSMSNFRRLPHFPFRLLTGPAAVALALLFAAPLASQTLTNAFGGLSASSKDPIDIESDVLVVHDKEKYATFKGNVKAVQGTTTLRARELNVYVGGDKLTSETKKGSEGQPAASTKVSDAEDGSVGNKNNSQTANKVSDAEDGGVGNNNDFQTTNMLGSSKGPIDIESDLFVVHDKEKYATFRGNVKAVQGTTTLRAGELKVNYVGGDKLAFGTKKEGGGEPAASTKVSDTEGDVARSDNNAQITKIEARGDVVITSEKDQRKNVLKGDRLVIDPKTGEIRFENTGNAAAGGRVRALFMPKVVEGAKSDGAGSSETKPGDATVEDETSSSDKPEVARASDGVPDVQGDDGAGAKMTAIPKWRGQATACLICKATARGAKTTAISPKLRRRAT